MPINPTYPGVYIEEVPSSVRTIMGVSTSVAAFVDFFSRGPLDNAVQIFNWGDFQREFGGLHKNSEASYAIQQFFINGGKEAWVVRVAKGAKTASATLKDETGQDVLLVTTGRKIKGKSVEDPGDWGNMLRVEVDYDTSDPDKLFNLTVSEVAIKDERQVQHTETYRNLTMEEGASNNAISVVNEGSRIIQLSLAPAAAIQLERPAQTGTAGAVRTQTPTLAKDDKFTVNYDSGTAIATITRASQQDDLEDLRGLVEAAIRAAQPNVPFLSGATVQLIILEKTASTLRFRLRVLGSRTGKDYNPLNILTFSNYSDGGTTDPTAANLGLINATANVQQYKLGETTGLGFQGAGEKGMDCSLPGCLLPGAAEIIGLPEPDKTGMYALEDVDLFNILCIPRTSIVTGDNAINIQEAESVITEATAYCEKRRAFFIVDTPSDRDEVQEIKGWMEAHATLRHKNAALYFPRVRISDPLNGYRPRSLGASGTIAGLFARTDSERGVWKAPAGTEAVLRNVTEFDDTMTDPENGVLNRIGVNCLRSFPVYGNICWGARTLMGNDQQASEWKYIPVRRLALYIEESLYRGTKWIVFEPNDEPLWAQIRLNVGSFMHGLFRQGAFQGSNPRDAYIVKCDKETTNQDDINHGIVNILVGFAPLKPAEFVIIKIQQMAGQINT